MYKGTRSPYGSKLATTPSFVLTDLEEEIKQLSPSSEAGKVSITTVHPLTSYTWIDAASPTAIVPGAPPSWTKNPVRVPQDSGLVYIDQNAARMGSLSPLTPLFAAVSAVGKDAELKGHDLVSDRNNLRKLLRWATNSPEDKDFRIDVQLAGGTCLFTRCEEKNSELITGFRGYGHQYEKAATTWPKGSENASGHHRIVSMKLGDVKVLLRFEVDACTGSGQNVDDLTAAMTSLSTSPGKASEDNKKFPSISGLKIHKSTSQSIVPQGELIELKTRASHKPLDWEEVYPQLYLSQTAYLYLAKHTKGNFMSVEKHALDSPSLQSYARRAESGIKKLHDVLKDIMHVVKANGSDGGLLSLVARGGRLSLYKRKAGSGKIVGEEILARFK